MGSAQPAQPGPARPRLTLYYEMLLLRVWPPCPPLVPAPPRLPLHLLSQSCKGQLSSCLFCLTSHLLLTLTLPIPLPACSCLPLLLLQPCRWSSLWKQSPRTSTPTPTPCCPLEAAFCWGWACTVGRSGLTRKGLCLAGLESPDVSNWRHTARAGHVWLVRVGILVRQVAGQCGLGLAGLWLGLAAQPGG